MKYVSIAVGGMLGAVLRFWVGIALYQPHAPFPFPTLVINLIGSFILGWFVVQGSQLIRNRTLVLGVQTGFLGSFTTFSAFSIELILLMDQGLYAIAIQYFLISTIMGIGAVLLGMKCGSVLLGKEGAEQ
ncbi:fluoride efflux transporter CrcB [Fictibacillus phosphorivorans]|uniref:fluoride efflux transporter CrcB n=1 Tax=Fictibacillus phosphorivorans TaxID=1221500 RepID=UPI00203B6381|nr:fluoride efflux transporter CrcB [Fictibacillus phosphorivorans]MCM3718591.1 fluoride efflux transporter CrcB [Fictibacillus phosphorivorans]MCM3776214.1 fluoride efflux transporter CrcB [Fictibacillus phosphorivorans]